MFNSLELKEVAFENINKSINYFKNIPLNNLFIKWNIVFSILWINTYNIVLFGIEPLPAEIDIYFIIILFVISTILIKGTYKYFYYYTKYIIISTICLNIFVSFLVGIEMIHKGIWWVFPYVDYYSFTWLIILSFYIFHIKKPE